MDIRKVKKLIELLEESDIGEIEIKSGDESVRISRYTQHTQATAVRTEITQATASDAPVTTPTPLPDHNTITSPMVGTFYAAPAPDAATFVNVGSTVNVSDTLCIIEAMKIMNPIITNHSGQVTHIFKSNGDTVEYGEPLFTIEP